MKLFFSGILGSAVEVELSCPYTCSAFILQNVHWSVPLRSFYAESPYCVCNYNDLKNCGPPVCKVIEHPVHSKAGVTALRWLFYTFSQVLLRCYYLLRQTRKKVFLIVQKNPMYYKKLKSIGKMEVNSKSARLLT